MIADTCFIIDLMRKKEPALKKLAELEKNNDSQYTTSPTVFELAVGVGQSEIPEKEKKKVFQVLSQFSVIEFDLESAWEAGIKLGDLFSKGNPVDPIDAQIAGIALTHDQIVVTRNVKHFTRFSDLKIDDYREK